MKHKIKVSKNGTGWVLKLYQKFWFLWLIDTTVKIKFGYEYMVDEQINTWVREFNVGMENITTPAQRKDEG